MRFTYLVLIAGLTFACGKIDKQEIKSEPIPGSENTNPSGPTIPAALTVADSTQLPQCTAAVEGQLVYARKEATFATCTSGNWTKLDIGSATGNGSGIQVTIYCNMSISKDDLVAAGLDTAPDGGINFDYTIIEFANKTRWVQGSLASTNHTYSKSTYWTDKQVGFATANSDDINFDVAGAADAGHFTFTMDKALTGDEANPFAVVYSDTAFTDGKAFLFNNAAECKFVVY